MLAFRADAETAFRFFRVDGAGAFTADAEEEERDDDLVEARAAAAVDDEDDEDDFSIEEIFRPSFARRARRADGVRVLLLVVVGIVV